MRLAWRLARREVRRRPGRTVLVVVLVAITVAGITVADLAYRSRELPGPSSLGRAAARALVSMPDGDTRDPFTLLRPYAAPGADTVEGYEVDGLPVRRADKPGLGMGATLLTVDARDRLLDGLVTVERGRLPSADDEVVVGPDLARVLQLGVGDTLHLLRPDVRLRIVGIGVTPDDSRALFLAPRYPIDQIRTSARLAALYMSAQVDPFSGVTDSVPVADTQTGPFVSVQTPPVGEPADNSVLLIGWVVMALVLGVLGIVVSAAFAASGRRQLVTLGQLGATGADERFARRFLALQGSATGLLGAFAGVATGVITAVAIGKPVLRRDQLNLVWFDVVVIVATTAVVGTLAALFPTRQLAKAPVLTALSGRAPVATVRRWQVPLGAISVVGGLLAMSLTVVSARGGFGGVSTAATIVAVLGGGAVLAGVCALSPVVVDRWGSVATRTAGSTRLALRSLVRHRARSAAMIAAISAVGAAGVAGASGIERWGQLDTFQEPVRLDVVSFDRFSTDAAANDTLRKQIEGVVGPVQWTAIPAVVDLAGNRRLFVASDEALAALDVPRSALKFGDDGTVTVWRSSPDVRASLIRPGLVLVPGAALPVAELITPDAARDPSWRDSSSTYVGHLGHDLTTAETDQLQVLWSSLSFDGYIFGDVPGQDAYFGRQFWEVVPAVPVLTRAEVRWMVIGALLLLVALIVGTGLALWAVEGRVERDQLVAVGAAPRSLAGMAGVRAFVLSLTGGVMAVPLGMVTLWVVLHAAGKDSPFPTLTAAMVAFGLPTVIAVGAFGASAVAQRLRPATASTMSLD